MTSPRASRTTTEETIDVLVEEVRNVVTVNAEMPNEVYVSVFAGSAESARTRLLYSDGPPWTVVIDVEG